MRIGEVIKQYRDDHELSQAEFSRRCGLSDVVISFIERGHRSDGRPYLPKFETVRKLARGMGISSEALIMQCDDFNLDIPVGMEETPLYADLLQSQSTDEIMLLQAYRMIPIEHRIEAMQAIFKIKEMYDV